eukprot:702911-Rhodomonas_salina.2
MAAPATDASPTATRLSPARICPHAAAGPDPTTSFTLTSVEPSKRSISSPTPAALGGGGGGGAARAAATGAGAGAFFFGFALISSAHATCDTDVPSCDAAALTCASSAPASALPQLAREKSVGGEEGDHAALVDLERDDGALAREVGGAGVGAVGGHEERAQRPRR